MAEQHFSELKRLPALYHLLTSAGFQLEPTRRLAVEDLLARLLVNNPNPPDKKVLGEYLAPILCRTPEQQRRFQQLFNDWLNPQEAIERAERVVAPKPEVETRKRPVWKPLAAAMLVLVLGALLIWGLTVLLEKKTTSPTITVATETTETPTLAPKTKSLMADADSHQIIRPIPLRIPQEVQVLSEKREDLMLWLLVLTASLPWLLWLVWLAYRLVDRQVILNRTKTDSGNPFDRLTLVLNTHHPFAQAKWMAPLRTAYREPTRRLDIARTMHQTLRKGLFTPVPGTRTRRPLYLVLIDRSSTQDHRASLALALVAQMRHQGVWVEAYEFYRDPHWCYPLSGSSEALSLSRLLGSYPEARLVITGDASGCFHPITGEAYPVLAWFNTLSCRVWLSTRAMPWGRVEAGLAASGFVVAPLSGEGMEAISSWLQAPKPGLQPMGPGENPLPLSLRRERERWLRERSQPPEEVQRLLRELRQYLGADGYLLLGACATYPQMHGNLAIALDQLLFSRTDRAHRAREQRLLKLARLPWSQEGTMPGYLRKALLQKLKADEARIAEAYLSLFNQAGLTKVPQGLELPFTVNPEQPMQLWRRRLASWLPHAPRNSALADNLFAQVLLSGRRGLLDFVLPKALAERLPGIRWGWGRIVLSLALAAVVQAGCVFVWWRIEDPFRQWQLQQMRHAFAQFPVVVEHSDAEAANAKLFKRLLNERGFTQVELLPFNPQQQRNSISGPGEASEAISVIEVLASHLRYGEKYYLDTDLPIFDAGGIHILWVEPLKPLSIFRDPLVHAINPQEWQNELAKLREEIAAAESQRAKAVKAVVGSDTLVSQSPLEQTEIFQDTLEKEGIPGPRMVLIPAGQFVMGSPKSELERNDREGPQHRVAIATFALGETEVTFEDYDYYAKAVGRELPGDARWGRGKRPVINVNWDEATAYARWLSKQTGAEYRLPTEAEWEYAGRAGTTTPFNTGNCINSQQANFVTTAAYGDCRREAVSLGKTTEAGAYPSNPFGLKDIYGNVSEWTQDCWHDSYDGAPGNGMAWQKKGSGDCDRRVLRGGSWFDNAKEQRSAFRNWYYAYERNNIIGFRLARTLQPEEVLPSKMRD